jgi:hypothetical protein
MSTPFLITIGDKEYQALPPSFAFQKKNKAQMKRLQAGTMAPDESQGFLADYITHCIKRVTPDLDVAVLEEDLDAIEIARASMEIGSQTQKQVAVAYGIDFLGEVKAG